MPTSTHTPRPRQSTSVIAPQAPDRWTGADDREPVARWQALLDARLIGTMPPLAPATLAAIRAAEAAICPRRTGGIW